ncbi:glycyl-radical enzyme activating protein [Pelagicoccus mobilis]|uniref:Glycyl-radical enzyme activating protein n=1 Tax=Pelagicoccus mobilis TaxID=415221 RepID=A0A934RXU3_9BACT|nr:glycyl-radical enzyme activating protein [Pelagicoccus mobilis]MBK1878747.1 glycyl-radical enzyme activating protein [Pelagicoccus mobilis]
MVDSLTGTITDIHRTSTVDGPGLRTTVFLKGCPLRCLWCHNPETQSREIQPWVEVDKVSSGDYALLGVDEGRATQAGTSALLERIETVGIEKCATNCVSGAIGQYGKIVSVDEVVCEVLKDRDYFENSGGGVTVSGGEPMSQPTFALSLLQACKENALHTVLDTTGMMSRRDLDASMEVTDLYLYDYKASDDQTHRRLTGVSQKVIRENLDRLIAAGKEIILRCPMIPEVNDDVAHLEAIARLMLENPGIRQLDVLTWHTMGKQKYERLGRKMPDCLPRDNVAEEQKQAYRDFFSELADGRVFVY